MFRTLSVSLAMILAGFTLASGQQVGQRTLKLEDSSRERPLVTEVWYPTSDPVASRESNLEIPFVRASTVREATPNAGKHPLILLSHGTGGGRLTLEWLAFSLAKAGYLVVSVDHWGNTFDNSQPEYFLRFWERPQDLTFVLNELLRDPVYGKIIDVDRVGALGFSAGGYTVLALAGAEMELEALYRFGETAQGKRESNIPEFPGLITYMQDPKTRERLTELFSKAPRLRDGRVKAVVALAPAIGQAFSEARQCAAVTAPTLIIVGEGDAITPVPTNARHYHQLIPHSQLHVLPGNVGHYVFLNEAREPLRSQAPHLFQDAAGVDRAKVHREVVRMALEFFGRNLTP